MTTQLLDSEIKYDRVSKDYSILISGSIVASAPNFSAAELIRSQLLSERIQDGCYATATELDGDPIDSDPDDPTYNTDGDQDRTPRNPIWRAASLIGVCDLHRLAQTDPREFRARLAALSDADLCTQATLYSIYATTLCGREIDAAETLAHFKLSVEVHRAQQRSEDAVCQVIYELALTDMPALIEFLRGHTDAQREQLAWRFAAWLGRECEITREPSFILKGWQQLCVGAAACGTEVAYRGYASGWDAAVALWAGADASVESYAGMNEALSR